MLSHRVSIHDILPPIPLHVHRYHHTVFQDSVHLGGDPLQGCGQNALRRLHTGKLRGGNIHLGGGHPYRDRPRDILRKGRKVFGKTGRKHIFPRNILAGAVSGIILLRHNDIAEGQHLHVGGQIRNPDAES